MSNNNNSSVRLNSTNLTNGQATQLYFKRMYELTKEYLKRRQGRLKAWWNSYTFFQKLVLILIFVGIPVMIFLFWVGRSTVQSLNRNLGANYSCLDITNDLPFIGVVSSDTTYQSLLTQYLTTYYPSMLSNGSLNYKIQHNYLTNEVDGEYTYSMWLYINGNESGVYSYFKHVLMNLLKTNNTISDNYNWSNYRYKHFKNVFVRGDSPQDTDNLNSIKQYPGLWLGPELTNLYVVFSNGTNSESYLLENLELNKWINITVTINNNTVSIFRNGELEITGMISGNLYINNIGNKNLYFMGDPVLGSTNQGFPGFMNYFNFYNSVLTPTEIRTLYTNYLPLISSYMKKSISYSIETAPTVNIISETQSFDETVDVY